MTDEEREAYYTGHNKDVQCGPIVKFRPPLA